MMLAMLYVTCPDAQTARRIATALLEQRLIACANLTACQSIYRWDGMMQDHAETVLVMKTRAALIPKASAAARALHPDATACIVAYDAVAADLAYAGWVLAETGAPPSSAPT